MLAARQLNFGSNKRYLNIVDLYHSCLYFYWQYPQATATFVTPITADQHLVNSPFGN